MISTLICISCPVLSKWKGFVTRLQLCQPSVAVLDSYSYTRFTVGMKYFLGNNWQIPELKDIVDTFSLLKYGCNSEYFYIVLQRYDTVTDVHYISNVTNYEEPPSSRFIIACAIIQFFHLSNAHFVPDPSYTTLFLASCGFTVMTFEFRCQWGWNLVSWCHLG